MYVVAVLDEFLQTQLSSHRFLQTPLLFPQNIIVIIGIVLVSIIIDKRSDAALVL